MKNADKFVISIEIIAKLLLKEIPAATPSELQKAIIPAKTALSLSAEAEVNGWKPCVRI